MTKNLVLNGKLEKPIILWNRTEARAIEHQATISHAVVAGSIEDAVSRSDHIWSCLSGQESVIPSFDKILRHDIRGKLFIECSTITPEATNELARKVIEAGAEFVAMPGTLFVTSVFGGSEQGACRKCADQRSLWRTQHGQCCNLDLSSCWSSGISTESVALSERRVGTVLFFRTCWSQTLDLVVGTDSFFTLNLCRIGRSVIDLSGELPGTASHLKIIGNVLLVQMIESVAEAHVLAEKTGMAAKHLHEVITSIFPGPFAIYSKRMSSGAYSREEVGASLSLTRMVVYCG